MNTGLLRSDTILPSLTLFFLSPTIAEIMTGSIPASNFYAFLEAMSLYGTGVLLIRETTRRLNLGWPSVMGLGLAFGIVEEGLSLQSLFNPDFLGLDISFGRKHGVNWVWTTFIIPYHAIYSIVIPIWITESIFYQKKEAPWLNPWVLCLAFLGYGFAAYHYYHLFYSLTNFNTSTQNYLSACAVAVLIIFISITRFTRFKKISSMKPPTPTSTGFISFTFTTIWFGLFSTIFIENTSISPSLITIAGVSVIALLGVLLSLWSGSVRWTIHQSIGIVLGCLIAATLYGMLVLSESHTMWDRVIQTFLSTLIIIILLLIARRTRKHTK